MILFKRINESQRIQPNDVLNLTRPEHKDKDSKRYSK